MDYFVARQARLGFGTIAAIVKTNPTATLFDDTSTIIDELLTMVNEQMLTKNKEIVVSTCLKINLLEVRSRLRHGEITQKDKDDIIIYCQNVVDALMAVG